MFINLPNDLADFVRQEVDSGRYASEQDLFLAGLRVLQQEREEAIAGITRGWQSVERGEGVPIEDADRMLRGQLGLPPRK